MEPLEQLRKQLKDITALLVVATETATKVHVLTSHQLRGTILRLNSIETHLQWIQTSEQEEERARQMASDHGATPERKKANMKLGLGVSISALVIVGLVLSGCVGGMSECGDPFVRCDDHDHSLSPADQDFSRPEPQSPPDDDEGEGTPPGNECPRGETAVT